MLTLFGVPIALADWIVQFAMLPVIRESSLSGLVAGCAGTDLPSLGLIAGVVLEVIAFMLEWGGVVGVLVGLWVV